MKSVSVIAAALCVATASLPAIAQTASDPSTPAPAAAAATPTPICTDRPTKANVVCTVPAGSFQLETDAINWTHNHDVGTTTDTILYTNPYLKYGLGSHADIEFNIAPYETVRTSAGGTHDTIGGVGDLYIRLKQQLTDGTGNVQVGMSRS